MKQQRFAVGEEVIIQSASPDNPHNGKTAVVLKAVFTDSIDYISGDLITNSWLYSLTIKSRATSGNWIETALKKKPKGSDLSFTELLESLKTPIESVGKQNV